MRTVSSATPYTWPWHGEPDPGRLALVALQRTRWRLPGPEAMLADDLLAELASAVRKAGGLVTVITDPAEPPPLPADVVVASTGASSAFHETALDGLLRRAGRTDLLLAGWGLEGPVHSTM